jgi:hypothetical protein
MRALWILALFACQPGDSDDKANTDETTDASDTTDGETTDPGDTTDTTDEDPVDDGFSLTCVDPVSLLWKDTFTGIVACADGSFDRTERAAGLSVPDPAPACDGTEPTQACITSAECTAATYAECGHYVDDATGEAVCGCIYACLRDKDCADDEACVAPVTGPWDPPARPQCLPAECREAADCESGVCGVLLADDGSPRPSQLSCRTDTDACRADEDCDGADRCVPRAAGWVCEPPI